MPLLLDPPQWPAHGTLWSHLISDSSLAELHRFAVTAGLPARGFERDHYDVPAARHDELLALGAQERSGKDLARALAASGLRRSARTQALAEADLRARWDALAEGPPSAGWRAIGVELTSRWHERGRLYHDGRHLREVLDAVDHLADACGATSAVRRAALLGAWFHDAVHTAGRPPAAPINKAGPGVPAGPSDEEASAVLARTALAHDGGLAEETARLVLLTATHRPEPGDLAGALLCDADLAVLGASPARYADYAAAIRAEYAHVPEPAFRTGRTSILQALLTGRLFHTAPARQRWDAAARANLDRELRLLAT